MEQINFWKAVMSDGFAVGILRISVAISLLRLDKDTKWYRWSLYAVIGESPSSCCTLHRRTIPSAVRSPSSQPLNWITKENSHATEIGFVILYTIQAIAWLFVYCKPYSGWWEFQWMNPFDPRCHDFNLFLALTYWNIGKLL
jgi:hypothetical protein